MHHLSQLHACPNLTTLEIELAHGIISSSSEVNSAMDWLGSEELLQTHLRSWSANAPSLVCFNLGVGAIISVSLYTILNLLSCVPSVEAVRLEVRGIARGPEIYPQYVPIHIAHLDINAAFIGLPDCSYIFDWMLSLSTPPILKSFKFDSYRLPLDSALWLTKFIQRTGGELESLALYGTGSREGT